MAEHSNVRWHFKPSPFCHGTSLVLTRLGPRVFKVLSGNLNRFFQRNAHADRPGNLGALPGLQQVCISAYAMQRATTHAEISPPCVPRCTPTRNFAPNQKTSRNVPTSHGHTEQRVIIQQHISRANYPAYAGSQLYVHRRLRAAFLRK